MPKEIERKFLLKDDSWRNAAVFCTLLHQGYAHFRHDPRMILRVRLAGERAFLTLKGSSGGAARSEFEYPIPLPEAGEILKEFCEAGQIEKRRYRVPFGRHVWEVDEFFGATAGLVLAEIELGSEDERFERTEWLGREVTGEVRFYNSRLKEYPFREWKEEERR